jgi:uncharacterized membrane protein YeaQ/YmgE (transglycosylase-associated protein family)
MSKKNIIWIGVIVGSFVGGFIPYLWGGGFLSFSSIILQAIGALVGIWLSLKVTTDIY